MIFIIQMPLIYILIRKAHLHLLLISILYISRYFESFVVIHSKVPLIYVIVMLILLLFQKFHYYIDQCSSALINQAQVDPGSIPKIFDTKIIQALPCVINPISLNGHALRYREQKYHIQGVLCVWEFFVESCEGTTNHDFCLNYCPRDRVQKARNSLFFFGVINL